MSEDGLASLERAKTELNDSKDASDVEQALSDIAEASADLKLREHLQEEALFRKLLDIYATTYSSSKPPRSLLRCIGNLLSDNEVNRAALIDSSDCVHQLKTLLSDYQPNDTHTELPDFAVKVFFNLCNDAPTIWTQACEQSVDSVIVDYLCKRTWHEEDEMLLTISAALLTNLFECKQSIETSNKYTTEYIHQILKLPFLLTAAVEALPDLLDVVSIMLKNEDCILQIVQCKRVNLVWDILGLIEDVARLEDTDEDEKKQYGQLLNAFAQSLADLSSIPAFNEKYTLEDGFIKQLCQRCIPSKEHPASLLPGCACLMLGNFAISDEVTTALVPGMVSVNSLFQHLGTSNESVFLNAAAGLLRHLAIPMKNRERFFDDLEYLKHVAHLYTDVTLEQIQLAGLQLTRQMLLGVPKRIQSLIVQDGASGVPTLSTFVTLFSTTTSTATKLEIARLVTAFLRSLQAPSVAKESEASLNTLVYTPDILSPLIFAAKQSPGPGVIHAQAEAWLALNLFARVPGGAGMLANATSGDNELVSLLRNRIAKTREEGVVAKNGASEETSQVADTRPEWLREKERDNAVLLVHDLLVSDDVTAEVKEGLRALLEYSEIRVR